MGYLFRIQSCESYAGLRESTATAKEKGDGEGRGEGAIFVLVSNYFKAWELYNDSYHINSAFFSGQQ